MDACCRDPKGVRERSNVVPAEEEDTDGTAPTAGLSGIGKKLRESGRENFDLIAQMPPERPTSTKAQMTAEPVAGKRNCAFPGGINIAWIACELATVFCTCHSDGAIAAVIVTVITA